MKLRELFPQGNVDVIDNADAEALKSGAATVREAHPSMVISGDQRLVTSGCIWAWPYETRIYDACDWIAGSGPLSLLYRSSGGETDLDPVLGPGDLVTCASVETSANLVPEADGYLSSAMEHLRDHEAPLWEAANAVRERAPLLLFTRHVDERGRVVKGRVFAIQEFNEMRDRVSPTHVVTAGQRLLAHSILDGSVDDLGPGAPHICVADDVVVTAGG
jgi:hypothetical protein